jgi:anti-sigma-K factor RskA
MSLDEDKIVLAAEYALGTLDADERAEAQTLMAIDPGFAAVVNDWERRLGELNALVAPMEPPAETWDRVKAKIAGFPPTPMLLPEVVDTAAPASLPRPPASGRTAVVDAQTPDAPAAAEVIQFAARARRWRNIATITGAMAATLVAFVVLREVSPQLLPASLRGTPQVVEKIVEVIKEVPSARPAQFVAVLQRDAASPAFLLTFDLDKRMLMVRNVQAEAHTGRNYELWMVHDRLAGPQSLGVIGEREFTVRPQLAVYDPVMINNATYAVSLEPVGGSPTGKPTGPVMYSGKLMQATPPSLSAPTP